MIPEQTATRTVRHTPEGFEVLLRAPRNKVVARIIGQLVFMGVGWFVLNASRAALQDWTTTREVHGFLAFVDNQEWSDRTIRWVLYGAIALSVYFLVAGIIDILIRLTRRDSILMTRGEWRVQRRALGMGRERVINPRSVTLELDSFERALTARSSERSVTISNLGTDADRLWLRDELNRQGTTTGLRLIPVGASRDIGAVRIKRRSDGSTFITQTNASRYGCALILSGIVAALIARGLLMKEGGGPWLGFGLFFSIVAILLWLSSNDHDEITIHRGSIRWRSSRFLRKFGGMPGSEAADLQDGALYLSTRRDARNSASHSIHAVDEGADVTLLSVIGDTGLDDAEAVMGAMAEASGFPIITERRVDGWRRQKLDGKNSGSTDGEG